MNNDKYYRRRYVISGIAVVVILIFLIRLFNLQIIDQSAKERSENNAQLRQIVYPARGLVYDRHGELLVANKPVYTVTMIRKEMQQFDTLAFCQALHISDTEFRQRTAAMEDRRKNRGYSPYTPQIFMDMLTTEEVATLQQELYKYPGISLQCRTLRDYAYPIAAHVLGNVGEVSQLDIDRDAYYTAGDYAGRDGIERTYENLLRGKKGVDILMRDSRGRIQGVYKDGDLNRNAQAGADIYLSIDRRTQQLAEELLQGKAGSIVVLEPHSGEILAMASSPSWDPNSLVGKVRSENYTALAMNPDKPLINRATQAQYSPGSTLKVLQALIGLQEGSITPKTKYPCNGPQSSPIKCTHHHGSPVSLEEGIEQSCNPYFWAVFRDMLQRDGYNDNHVLFKQHYTVWREDIMSFGLGQRFEDSDISEQAAGYIPTTTFYDNIYGTYGWKAITIRSLAIGQGEILVTPLQLANMAAAIANKGYYITPHFNHNDSMKSHIHTTRIDSVHFEVVQEGMARVMMHGTGRWYNIPTLKMCGKTGTVQNVHGKDHALFIGFAPKDDPKIAVAVAIENAGYGATHACPVASLIMEQYLTDEIGRKWLYERIKNTKLAGNTHE